MGAKKEALILKALEERKRYAGRHLLPRRARRGGGARRLPARARARRAIIEPVGSLRRGCDTCGDLDMLASGAPRVADGRLRRVPAGRARARARRHEVERPASSGGFQADLRLVAADSRGAALQYFTGSKAHNIALRDRAIGLGFKLNEYGLFRVDDDARVAGEREEDIYAALGLDWIPPELREMRGEIEAAADRRAAPPDRSRRSARRSPHAHHRDRRQGRRSRTMAEAAREAGLEYIAITDHSQSLAMANGLDERRALAHAARIRALDAEGVGVRLLAGIECDIKPDGSLDLADDCLAALDIVVASVHSAFNQDRQQMTDRLLRAIENPHVDILGHPTGRMLLKRQPYPVDIEAVVDAAARHGVALEINCQVASARPQRRARASWRAIAACRSSSRATRTRGTPSAACAGASLVARRAWLEPARRAEHAAVRRLPRLAAAAPEPR